MRARYGCVAAATEAMESELAELSAHLEAATHRQLALIRELEPTFFWAARGATSYAGWLSWRIGLAPGAAREKIRVARALGQLPAIDEAFRAAKLSYSKVRALTRVADATNEAALLNMALCATAAHLELVCRGIRQVERDASGAVVSRDGPPERWVRERNMADGMVRIEAQLHPDEAALVWRAIELARGLGGDGVPIDPADAPLPATNDLTYFDHRQLPEAHRSLLRSAPRRRAEGSVVSGSGRSTRTARPRGHGGGPMTLKIGWSHDPENPGHAPRGGGPMTLKIRWSLQAENTGLEVVPSG